jgi:phage baseplate assembly protein W
MQIGFPIRIDGHGRTKGANDKHIRQMIEQVLFTAPGERVNRPEFGSGLMQLVFGPNSPELAAATEYTVQGALQQWLGDVIQVDSVEVTSVESTLTVLVRYRVLQTQQQHIAEFSRETGI